MARKRSGFSIKALNFAIIAANSVLVPLQLSANRVLVIQYDQRSSKDNCKILQFGSGQLSDLSSDSCPWPTDSWPLTVVPSDSCLHCFVLFTTAGYDPKTLLEIV